MNSKLAPTDAFPDDLAVLNDTDLQVLHSRLQRQLDHEYAHAFEADPETEFRLADVLEELDHRESSPSSRIPDTAFMPVTFLV
ncbi:hypothetical protein MN0502_33820 (plasmid) [Arthrobacter sp. MN05-02]|nr:hypothetical protein MN0502_33820 [Arthrobacter sp. MN05-02]